MKKHFVKTCFILILSFLCFPFIAPSVYAEGTEWPESLVLGMVPSREVSRMIESLDPLCDLLSAELDMPVQGAILTNFTGVIEAMGTGRVDVGIFGPFALVLAEERHDAKIILNSIRRGSDSYKAQFLVREDSGFETVEDLRGKVLAFVDPASAGGFLFPFVHLMEHEIDPDKDLTYIFAGSHDAAVMAVYNKDVDAATTFDDARLEITDEYPDVLDVVKILEYTTPIPNDGVAVRKELHPQLIQAIQQAFITIGETEEGQELLSTLYNVTGYVEADSERYDIVRRTFELMQSYIQF